MAYLATLSPVFARIHARGLANLPIHSCTELIGHLEDDIELMRPLRSELIPIDQDVFDTDKHPPTEMPGSIPFFMDTGKFKGVPEM